MNLTANDYFHWYTVTMVAWRFDRLLGRCRCCPDRATSTTGSDDSQNARLLSRNCICNKREEKLSFRSCNSIFDCVSDDENQRLLFESSNSWDRSIRQRTIRNTSWPNWNSLRARPVESSSPPGSLHSLEQRIDEYFLIMSICFWCSSNVFDLIVPLVTLGVVVRLIPIRCSSAWSTRLQSLSDRLPASGCWCQLTHIQPNIMYVSLISDKTNFISLIASIDSLGLLPHVERLSLLYADGSSTREETSVNRDRMSPSVSARCVSCRNKCENSLVYVHTYAQALNDRCLTTKGT